jgi:nucleotide-binding universal stress UspA family protein
LIMASVGASHDGAPALPQPSLTLSSAIADQIDLPTVLSYRSGTLGGSPPVNPTNSTMTQSSSQARRAAAAAAAPAAPAADPLALLDAIDAAEWAGPPAASSGTSSGASQRQPIAWPADLIAVAQAAGVALPAMPPRRIAGSPVAWAAAYAPSSDLACLSEPIPTGTGKTGEKGTDQILYDACHGRFVTPA